MWIIGVEFPQVINIDKPLRNNTFDNFSTLLTYTTTTTTIFIYFILKKELQKFKSKFYL